MGVLWALALLLGNVGCDAGGAPARFTPAWTGVIEGFYGPPYQHAERLQVIEFVAQEGMDTYLYAPKQDPYHRDEWRVPYPAAEAAELQALVARGRERGVRVVLALAPGSDYGESAGDDQALRTKLDQLLDLGARDLCVLFDDVPSDSPLVDPAAQVAVLRLAYHHVRGREPGATVCFIGPYYFGTAEQLASGMTPPFPFTYEHTSDEYYAAYRALPRDMPILWTGAHVVPAELSGEQARAMRRHVDRPLLLWDNLPVNDVVLAGDVFLGPWQRPGAALVAEADGVLLNLGTQPRASLVMVGAAAHQMRDGLDADTAWARGAADVDAFLESGDVLQRLAAYYRAHPLLPDTRDAIALQARMDAWWAQPDVNSEAALRDELTLAMTLADDVAALADPTLAAELAPAASSLREAASVALDALDAVLVSRAGGAPDAPTLTQRRADLRSLRPQPGGHAPLPNIVLRFLSDAPPVRVDVFGGFVDRALTEL
ncbi:MAG: beta-N-acetylglucosaminidase domain-containing protein [Myxococcales bacterium]|nr:beta-N-acetylglucosaminidase domain-containing protein [Myxococcales bacterium]MCB9630217.1 beta-N-acetylglucosaminidase domain-containing protein [Sandaracinaceae bacterium]